ncbi:MAG: DUF4412 domain-containing protein [Candidatus Omnitrophica bacterium]|nr:DUF4412 domain-containing protein [Candidatus Omnitrophota bacterium]
MRYLSFIFLGVLGLSFILNAGVRMVSDYEDYEVKEKGTHISYIEKDKMRYDVKTEKRDMAVIFRADKELFWSIDNKKKNYIEITKADMERMKKKMEEGMKMMEEQFKNLPPEQRKKMEEMMKGKMKIETPKIVYKKVATAQKVNQWVCDKYEGYEGKNKVEEIWTTDFSKIGLKPEDLKIMEEMGKFFSEMMKGVSFYKIQTEKKEDKFFGVPVRIIGYDKGEKKFKMELKEIKRENLAPTLFEIPKGYKKEKLKIEE